MNREKQILGWGLAAYGKSGSVEIDLDEALTPSPDLWSLQIRMKSVTFSIQIKELELIEKIYAFLKNNYGKTKQRLAKKGEHKGIPEGTVLYSMVDEFCILESENNSVSIRKCGEFPDRFIFNGGSSEFSSSINIYDPETSDLIKAFKNLIADLNDE